MKLFIERFSDLSIIIVVFVFLIYLTVPQINFDNYPISSIRSKFIYFAYMCFILSVLYILYYLFSKSLFLSISSIDIVLFLLFGYVTVNRYFIQDKFGFSTQYFELLGLGLLFTVLRSPIFKNHLWLFIIIIVSGIVQCFSGILQQLGYFSSNHEIFHITGSFFNPGPFAGFLAVIWSMAFGIYLFRKNISKDINNGPDALSTGFEISLKYLTLVGMGSMLLLLIYLKSSASWLAILISSLWVLELKYTVLKRIFQNVGSYKRIILIGFIGLVFNMVLWGGYTLNEGSSQGRFLIWEVTSQMIKENPFLGVGYDRFRANYMNYQAHHFEENGETIELMYADNVYYTFNEWIQFLAESGLIGLLFLISLMYFLITLKVDNKDRVLYCISVPTLSCIGIFAFFSYPLQILPIKLIIIAILATLSKMDMNRFILIRKQNKSYIKLGTILISFFCLTLIFYQIIYIQSVDEAFKNWKSGLTSFFRGSLENSLIYYESAYPILNKDGDFLADYGKILSLNKRNEQALTVLLEAKHQLNSSDIETTLGHVYKEFHQYKLAEKSYKNACYMVPSKFYPMYSLAILYRDTDNKDKAMNTAKKLLSKKVKIPSEAINEMKAEMIELLGEVKTVKKI